MSAPVRSVAFSTLKHLHATLTRASNRAHSFISLAAVLAIVCLPLSVASAQNDVLTHHNDVARTGQNLNETILTPGNVNISQFGKLFTQNVDGIVAAQPLYASSVLMGDGLVHNVVIVATQNNTVYAFDADDDDNSNASPIWAVSLNDGGTADPIADYGCTGTGFKQIGITSTPVIDTAKTTVYVVAKTVNGQGNRQFALHALNIATGAETLGGPVTINGTVGADSFLVVYQIQRPALLLENGSIYIGFGGNGCDIYNYNGWLFVYNPQNLQQQTVFEVAPNGKWSSLWGGGAGPAADEFGNIYVVTANGTYDGPGAANDYGDSVLKMNWNGSAFGIEDYFTPYNQLYLDDNDLDLGSAGALILPDQPGSYPHELIAGGKEGTLYLINRDNLGQYNGISDNVIQTIPGASDFQLVGVPTYWNGNVYIAGDRDFTKQYSLINGMLTTQPVSETSIYFGGNGAASTSLSANQNTNGILWAVDHSNYVLFGFDATNLGNEFYSSKKAPHFRDQLGAMVRFTTPTVSNGHVYVAGKSTLTVFGLLPLLSPAAGNNQSGSPSQVLPTPLTVLAADAYSHVPQQGISITCSDGHAGGTFSPGPTQTTGGAGTITFTYQLPGAPKEITITCSSPTTTSATFSEACVPGAPASMKGTSGNNQKAPPASPLPKPLVVKVFDANGIAVPGVTITFSDNGAGGSFSPPSAVTNTGGKASTQYTTGVSAGKISITASTPGVSSASFKETVE
ncbi:MAG: hypothetical protein WBV46_00575 [Terriglobales bacterium]